MALQHRRLGTAVAIAAIAAVLAGCDQGQTNPGSPARTEKSASPNPPSGDLWFGKSTRDPTPSEVARMIEPNVMGIASLFDPFNPWLWDIDRTRITGVKVAALYLLGPQSTGVFGDGIIRPRMYVAQRDDQGKRDYKLIKEWSFDVNQAMPFRAKKRARWGWGYALYLAWGDLDLAGKEIRLIISFERTDGLVITGNKKEFRVPAKPLDKD